METQSISPSVATKLEFASAVDKKAEAPQVQQTEVSAQAKTNAERQDVLKASEIDELNLKLAGLGQGVAFSYDESTKVSVVKLVDKTTDEVLKQFPSEDALRIIRNIQNYLSENGQNPGQDNKGLTGAIFNEII